MSSAALVVPSPGEDDMEGHDNVDLSALHEARRNRLDHIKDGPYYIAPDSAPPIPDAMERRVDPGMVDASFVRLEKLEREDATVQTSALNPPSRSPYHLPKSSRARLLKMGGPEMAETLADLETFARADDTTS